MPLRKPNQPVGLRQRPQRNNRITVHRILFRYTNTPAIPLLQTWTARVNDMRPRRRIALMVHGAAALMLLLVLLLAALINIALGG